MKQVVGKKINKKQYLYPLTVSLPGGVALARSSQTMVFTLFGLLTTAAAVNYAFYTHLKKYTPIELKTLSC